MSAASFQMPENVFMEEKEEGHGGIFTLKPLERGYSVTVGNALRRVLLSSLEGYAITSLRIPGVLHEFSTVKGVVEDVTEVILNLKAIRLKKKNEGEESVIRVLAKGKKEITGADIAESAAVYEVLNPELVICRLEKGSFSELELTVAKGRGYVSSEENSILAGDSEGEDTGVIFTDSIFTPIRNVSYDVENVRVGQRTDYEKLILKILTDGSLTPKTALQKASRVLMQHFLLFTGKNIKEELQGLEEGDVVDEEILRMRRFLKTPLEELSLSARAYNCLKSANVNIMRELVQLRVEDMMKFRNFGKKSLAELKQMVSERDLSFGMDLSKYKVDDE